MKFTGENVVRWIAWLVCYALIYAVISKVASLWPSSTPTPKTDTRVVSVAPGSECFPIDTGKVVLIPDGTMMACAATSRDAYVWAVIATNQCSDGGVR